ncbi:hypothetical protein [Desulfuromonas thiophila]|uniref:hypothetical protein n=1 Tax=Desulfuromonas thiophila TaxID=57664 RepID=UPI0029F5A888|nr:hypothetical protein [Desulfuromonas thiophila]
MSLINQMLRDLEARRPASPASAAPLSGRRRRWWPIGLALVLVLLGLAGGLLLGLGLRPPLPLPPASSQVLTQKVPHRPAVPAAQGADAPDGAADVAPPRAAGSPSPLPVEPRPEPAEAYPVAMPQVAVVAAVPVPATAPALAPAPTAPARPLTAAPVACSTLAPRQIQPAAGATTTATWLYRARQAWQQGELATASHVLDQALNQAPTDLRLLQTLVALQTARQQPLTALPALQRATALAPQEVALHLLQARLLADVGQPAAAQAVLARPQPPALERQPDFYALQAALAQQLGQSAAASALYRQLCAFDGERGDWWLGLAISQQQQGELSAARHSYRQALAWRQLPAAAAAYARQQLKVLAPVEDVGGR